MPPGDRRSSARCRWLRPAITAVSVFGLLAGATYVVTQSYGVTLFPHWQLSISMQSGPRHSCSLAANDYRVAEVRLGDNKLPLTIYVSKFDDEISASVLNSSKRGDTDMFGHTNVYRFYDTLCGTSEIGKCQGLVLDVGAYIGTHALYLASLGYEVHALEPMRPSADLLRCSAAANSLSNLHVVAKAASDRNGTDCLLHPPDSKRQTTLVAPRGADCSTLPELRIEVVTLDTYWTDVLRNREILLLKIDVEGHEDHVLAGAAQLLSRSPPRFVLLEYYPEMLTLKGVPLPDFFNRIFRASYRIHDCQQGVEIPRTAEGLDKVAVYKDQNRVTNLLLVREVDYPEEVALPKWVCTFA